MYYLKEDGSVWASGDNSTYNLGNPDIEGYTTTPVQVVGLTNVKQIWSADTFSYALKQDNTLWGWGWDMPYLQDSYILKHPVPVLMGQTSSDSTHIILNRPSSNIVYLDGSVVSSRFPSTCISDPIVKVVDSWSTFAVAEDGSVWQWEGNNKSLLDPNLPFKNDELTGFIDFCDAPDYSVFLKNDGTVWVKGDNTYGQLGMGNTTSYAQLTQNPYLSNIISIEKVDYTIFA